MGDGKLRLLTEIDRLGSLSAATKSLKISYRKAWGDIRKVEQCLGQNLVEKTRGGSDGGNTVPTDEGNKVVRFWAMFRSEVSGFVDKSFAKFMERLGK